MISPQQHMEVLHKEVVEDPITEAGITVAPTMLEEAGAADSATEDDPVRMRRNPILLSSLVCEHPVCDIDASAATQGAILRTESARHRAASLPGLEQRIMQQMRSIRHFSHREYIL
jgi:hypothetical protein